MMSKGRCLPSTVVMPFGVIVSMPIFNGNLYAAKQRGAELRAQILEAGLRDEENTVVREVRIAALNLTNAGERVDIAEGLLDQSRKTYALADARYKAGASSIVELSQAELNQTTSEIALARARYELLLQRSVLDYQTGALTRAAAPVSRRQRPRRMTCVSSGTMSRAGDRWVQTPRSISSRRTIQRRNKLSRLQALPAEGRGKK